MKRRAELAEHFDVHHPGLADSFRFSTSSDLDIVGNAVKAQGLAAYETPTVDILIELSRTDPGLFIDVGANTGLYALAVTAADPAVHAVAFEPLESVRELLRHNVELNPELAARITIEPLGLSNETGAFTFYETINDQGFVSTSSSLDMTHIQAVGGEHVERTIPTITLDDFAQTLGDQTISLMKIDVEGHEHAVISGGRGVLATHRPILTVEVLGNSERGPMEDLLARDNYFAFAMAPGELRQRDRLWFFDDAWNHLLVPAEKVGHISALCRTLGLRLDVS
ncbi:FkbM family methyltransferase [Aeromicrobium panaciterrae]|uniref:FkbM family methyltransferase n=1 Tax=Aeromicrobium panaciterrae TaxID=363861 RepID=A0ABU1UK28_9ACTN|nr:FkbM family methyltransferase [Aeromicrobium panaciterrae]MDR7085505.1 FkbM family methyltransferase [Aeromicrobium panaciterrae]